MADKRTSTPTPSARAPKEPAKPAPQAKVTAEHGPAKTVKIVKKPSGNQAVVLRKTRTPALLSALPTSERHRLVAEAAYYLAEARGFAPGHAAADWHAAEQAIAERYRFT